MFHFDRKLQQQESDTSSASDSTTDVTSRIGVITPTEDKEGVEHIPVHLILPIQNGRSD